MAGRKGIVVQIAACDRRLEQFGERNRVRDVILSLLVAGYRPATVRLALSVVRNLLNAARFEDRLLKANVAEGLSRLLPPRRLRVRHAAGGRAGRRRAQRFCHL